MERFTSATDDVDRDISGLQAPNPKNKSVHKSAAKRFRQLDMFGTPI